MMRWRLSVAALSAFALIGQARAAGLSVTPILLEGSSGATASLTVRNGSNVPVNVEAKVMVMEQDGGRERLVPASRVVVSPPVAQLKPRQDYVFRAVRLGHDPVSAEEAYRVVVTELPNPVAGTGVNVALAHAVPLFFEPRNAKPAALSWHASVSRGRVTLTATNEGGRRARISNVKLSDGRSTIDFERGSLGYVLADATMSWVRPAKSLGAGPLRLTAESDGGPIDVRIDPDR
ncbi:pilus assembly protein [Alsobacter soli]|uniref:Pilus assembly protein n=1 Tax=Alsobacter soli TaxID=2109933 RepID=A0A2T1HLM3_9HYPH|nr:fimbria/pilus periplasmic chaperone [Alsobacter soli]PSC02542.1 pilus assembly protein [Alsobacter soli]